MAQNELWCLHVSISASENAIWIFLFCRTCQNVKKYKEIELVLSERAGTINSNLPIDSWPGCKLHYTRWTGTVVAGQVTLLGSALAPEGHDIVALFFSPLSNVHIAMFRQGDNVYAWSENYTGEFVYDVLMLIYPANAQAQKQ